jgi:hypothetical protein
LSCNAWAAITGEARDTGSQGASLS